MRKVLMLVTVPLIALGLAACGSSGSSDSTGTTAKSAPSTAKLTGKVTDKGTTDVSGKTDAKVEVEADDFYFKPSYVTAKPGQKIAVALHNEGKADHTFTISSLGIDTQLSPGATKNVTVTVPDQAGPVEFHCSFHGSMGMRGAFVVVGGSASGATGAGGATSSSSSTTSTTSGGGGGYGY